MLTLILLTLYNTIFFLLLFEDNGLLIAFYVILHCIIECAIIFRIAGSVGKPRRAGDLVKKFLN